MHSIADQHASTIAQFRRWLDATQLAEILSMYENHSEDERDAVLRRDLVFLPESIAALLRYFVLGDDVADPGTLLDANGLALLAAIGFDPRRHRLIRHMSLWLFCERLNPAVDLYHGDDSFGLSRVMLPGRGRCLDLCSGVGVQAMLLAQTATSVVAVEKQEKASLFFAVNAVLNGLSDRLEFRNGDFVEAVRGERFDHIVCNPPLLPIPRDVAYPLAGDGGPDGLDFTRRLLCALPDLLNPGGRCHLVGTMLGSSLGPDLREWQDAAVSSGMKILAILPFRLSVAPGAPMFESLVSSAALFAERLNGNASEAREHAAEAYRQYFRETGVTHFYSYFLCVSRPQVECAGEFRCTRHFMDTRAMWVR